MAGWAPLTPSRPGSLAPPDPTAETALPPAAQPLLLAWNSALPAPAPALRGGARRGGYAVCAFCALLRVSALALACENFTSREACLLFLFCDHIIFKARAKA
jgi:hypothetical protein